MRVYDLATVYPRLRYATVTYSSLAYFATRVRQLIESLSLSERKWWRSLPQGSVIKYNVFGLPQTFYTYEASATVQVQQAFNNLKLAEEDKGKDADEMDVDDEFDVDAALQEAEDELKKHTRDPHDDGSSGAGGIAAH